MNEYMEHVTSPHDDALFITKINNFVVKRILVNFESSTGVLFLNDLLAKGNIKQDLKKVALS